VYFVVAENIAAKRHKLAYIETSTILYIHIYVSVFYIITNNRSISLQILQNTEH
jgi:hypothetical protein